MVEWGQWRWWSTILDKAVLPSIQYIWKTCPATGGCVVGLHKPLSGNPKWQTDEIGPTYGCAWQPSLPPHNTSRTFSVSNVLGGAVDDNGCELWLNYALASLLRFWLHQFTYCSAIVRQNSAPIIILLHIWIETHIRGSDTVNTSVLQVSSLAAFPRPLLR